jgi:chromosome segregation protein
VQQHEAGEKLGAVQAEGYRISGELARIEQQIGHQRELRQRLETARAEADAAFAQIGEHITGDERQLGELRAAIGAAEPALEAINAEGRRQAGGAARREGALLEWQQRWDAYAIAQAESSRWAEVERTKIEYLEKQGSEQSRRRESLWRRRARSTPARCRRSWRKRRPSTTATRPGSTRWPRRWKRARRR